MTKRTRSLQKKVRFTKKENDYLNRKMELSGLETFQLYAHTMLIQGEVIQVDYSELLSLVIEVKRIGTNINQVAKLANQFSDISIKDIEGMTQQLEKLTRLVEQTLKKETDKHSQQTEVD